MSALRFFLVAILWTASVSPAFTTPSIHVVPGEQMRIDLFGSSVTANGSQWDIVLRMDDDNENPGLGSTFRRWWHVEIRDLNEATGETLNVTVTNSGYSDNITAVWSLDGGATYTRIPSGQSSLNFSVTTPPGVTSVRLAKYFPYTLAHFAAFRSTVTGHPRVTESVIGNSVQGRPIYLWEITDASVAPTGKRRVWIHTAVHPAENTAYFMTEGLVVWLLSGDAQAEILLDNVIFDIVPMANPDGVHLGNYRTNANSVNLEVQWGSPYNSTVAEVVALRTKIEEFMGTAGSPGANPIRVLLNLHATHSVTYPFHFVHTAASTSTENNAMELQWVNAFRGRSAYVNLGTNQSSSLSPRAYVESMMFDRYSSQPQWDNVMAITFEGTYQAGPTPGVPNVPDDYRQVGMEMGLAIADFFGINLSTTRVEGWMVLGE